MYKKVMVAIDDSEKSWNALQEAGQIAAAYGAKLSIVHAVQVSDHATSPARQTAARLLEEAKSRSSRVEAPPPEIRLLEADGELGLAGISEAIAGAVVEWEADLLVVGSKGRRGLERLVIGSVAEQLISTIGISIFLVRLH